MMRWRGEAGIALVITLLVMTILLIMGSAFMSISSTETLIAINERSRLQAYHLAEAGAEMAIAQLNANSSYPGTPAGVEQFLGLGTYEVTVTDLPPLPGTLDRKQITSTGYVPNKTVPIRAMAQVETVVRRNSQFPFGLIGLSLIDLANVVVDSYDRDLGDYGVTLPDGISVNAGSEGHIHSNNNIKFWSNNTINGNAELVAPSITENGSGNVVTGTTTTGVSPISVEAMSCPAPGGYVTGVDPPAAYNGITYDLTVGPGQTVTLDPGTYAFNKITLGAGAQFAMTGPVVICMTGQFVAHDGAVINTSKIPANLVIFSSYNGIDGAGTDAMYFDNGSGEFYGGIYALNGEVEFQNATAAQTVGWQIFGAIVADRVDIEEKALFHYDLALARSSGPGGNFVPVAGTWREVLAP
ncbi:MAG: PilX N-terminal domain-containing pilus assembly protein [Candidatus Methylomirabilales bacterium]